MSLGYIRGGFVEGRQVDSLGSFDRSGKLKTFACPDIHCSMTLGKSLILVRINELISGKVL